MAQRQGSKPRRVSKFVVTGATIIECSKVAFLFDVGIWHFQPIHVVAYAKDRHYEGAYWGLQVPRYHDKFSCFFRSNTIDIFLTQGFENSNRPNIVANVND